MAKQNKVTETKDEKNTRVAEELRADNKRSNAGDAPFADPSTDPDKAREPQVGEEVTTSFDERTGVTAPFLRADGAQDNGAADLSEPEGARAEQTREGDKTTVEETDTAIEEGIIEGPQVTDEDLEKAKNPTK